MALKDILVDTKHFVATITINRPKALNALTIDLRHQLGLLIEELNKSASVRVIILTGAGERAFSAGLDLKELSKDEDTLKSIYDRKRFADPVESIRNLTKPIICAVNGVAITGGFELAINCDIIVGSRNAAFADTHSLVGVLPAWGLSQKLSELIGPSRAKELSLSGRFIYAEEAFSWGLINSIQEPENLLDYVFTIAKEIAKNDLKFISEYKKLIDQGNDLRWKESIALEYKKSKDWNLKLKPEVLARKVNKFFQNQKSKK